MFKHIKFMLQLVYDLSTLLLLLQKQNLFCQEVTRQASIYPTSLSSGIWIKFSTF